MRYYIFLALCFLGLQVYGQKKSLPPMQPNKTINGKKQGEWLIWYNRNWKTTTIADSVAYYRKVNFLDNKPVGLLYDYYRSGTMQFEGAFLTIEPEEIHTDGVCKWYFENGKLSTESTYKNNLHEGQSKAFYENGNLESIFNYKNGIKHGVFKTYFENSKLKVSGYYKNGERDSLWIWYKETGVEDDSKNYTGDYKVWFLKNEKANSLKEEGMLEEALIIYKENLSYAKTKLGENHPDYASSLNNLAGVYESQGNYAQALPLYQEALAIDKKVLGENHPAYATSLNNLAYLYVEQGNYAQALPLYQEALAIRKKVLGENHPDYASSLNNLAGLYDAQGNYTQALPFYEEALAIRKKVLRENHPDYATSLNNLAGLYDAQGNYAQALPLYQEALAIRKKVLGENHPAYATGLNNLAYLYNAQGNYTQALPLYQEALDIRKKVLGENHPTYATSLNNLAYLYDAQGNYAQALPLYQEALAIYKKVLGENHPDYASSLNNLALLYNAQGNYAQALPLFKQANQLFQQFITKSRLHLSEKELLLYLNKELYNQKAHQSIALQWQDTALIAATLNANLLIKGMGLQNSLLLQKAIAIGTNDSLKAQYRAYISLKKQITMLEQLSSKEREGKNYQSLTEQANQLEKQLMQKSTAFQQDAQNAQINWKAIQQHLAPDAIAIEFTDFDYYDKEWTDKHYYAAYLIRKDWVQPKLVKLFEAQQLDTVLKQFNKPEQTAMLYQHRGAQNTSNMPLADYAEQLYPLLFAPLEQALKDIKTIYLAPSGALYQLALGAIQTPMGKSMSEQYELHIVTSARSLAEKSLDEVKPFELKQAEFYGGIEYDKIAAKLYDTLPVDAPVYTTAFNLFIKDTSTLLANRDMGSQGFSYLKGTEKEVSNINAFLKGKGISTQCWMHEKASEEQFKQLDTKTKPQILHIATHGFFLKNTTQKKNLLEFNSIDAEKKGVYQPKEDPMLRSGLVMAGANKIWTEGNPYPDREDGILTALELSNLDLQGCQLAVLSACETGLGDIKGSEGVYGLQRAFKKAGVKNILVSLWSINDEKTVEFMQDFYDAIIKTSNIYLAFTQTQNVFKAKYKNPLYWAAFQLVE